MTWVTWFALVVVGLALLRCVWSAFGPVWRWPVWPWPRRLARAGVEARRRRRSPVLTGPDPFVILEVQQRLSVIATELRVLESADADLTYWARAHRIHTRRSAYDQLLVEACRLAGVPNPPGVPDQLTLGNELRIYRTEDERFCAEIELAARGWHW
jgi:hypothetical protein